MPKMFNVKVFFTDKNNETFYGCISFESKGKEYVVISERSEYYIPKANVKFISKGR